MIKLNKPNKPDNLAKKEKELIEIYKKEKKNVWRKNYIIQPLLESSYGKCAYCEKIINWKEDDERKSPINEKEQLNYINQIPDEDAFLHIDHFIPKTVSPELVVDWDNLIPSCPTCNINKNKHNPKEYPIINPYNENPKKFFIYHEAIFIIKNNLSKQDKDKANTTITLFNFELRYKNFKKYTDEINKIISDIKIDLEKAIKESNENNNAKLTSILNKINKLFSYCSPKAEFSAINSSFILQHPYYKEIKENLKDNKLWKKNLQDKENTALSICLCSND